MFSDRKIEMEEMEGWIEIIPPEKEVILLEKELESSKAKIAEASELKKDVQAYWQETVNVLQKLELSKLDTTKLENELKDARIALDLAHKERDKIATIFTQHIDNHGDTINDLQMMRDENTHLKNQQLEAEKRIKTLKQQLNKQKKIKATYRKLKKTYLKVSKNLIKELNSAEQIILVKTKLNAELSMQLHTANVWADHFEKLTIKNKQELDALRKENTNQKQIIERLSRSEVGLFSPRKLTTTVVEQNKQAKPF